MAASVRDPLMEGASEKWADLAVRLASGAGLVSLGLLCLWLGGPIFFVLVSLICGLMVWELVRMLTPERPGLALQLGCFSAVAAAAAIYLPTGLGILLLLLPAATGLYFIEAYRAIYAIFTAMVLLAGYGMMSVRDGMGFEWLLWLVLVVVVTDVVGYFAGRMIGGPKFWPRVSPKKTWAGTSSGWLGAAAVGAVFMVATGAGAELIALSVAVSLASQMGDIAESAIKRKVGVKDSSNLIPGHGGVLDRFDGMLFAAVFLLLAGPIVGFPPGAG